MHVYRLPEIILKPLALPHAHLRCCLISNNLVTACQRKIELIQLQPDADHSLIGILCQIVIT